jgi:hypothetical protein
MMPGGCGGKNLPMPVPLWISKPFTVGLRLELGQLPHVDVIAMEDCQKFAQSDVRDPTRDLNVNRIARASDTANGFDFVQPCEKCKFVTA